MGKFKSDFWASCLIFTLFLFIFSHTVQAQPPWLKLLQSEEFLYVFKQTPEGRALASKWMARGVETASDVRSLVYRLEYYAQYERSFAAQSSIHQLEKLGARIEQELKISKTSDTLTVQRQALLDKLTARELTETCSLAVLPQSASTVGLPFNEIFKMGSASVDAALPASTRLFPRMEWLEKKYFTTRKMDDAGGIADYLRTKKGVPNPTIGDVLKNQQQLRREFELDLFRLAQDFENKNPALDQALRKFAEVVHRSPRATDNLMSRIRQTERIFYKDSPDLAQNLVNTYVSDILGQIGELKVLALENNVNAWSKTVEQWAEYLVRTTASPLQRTELSQALERVMARNPDLRPKEIDLICESGSVWGEVKYAQLPYETEGQITQKMLLQAQKTARLRDEFMKEPAIRNALGGHLELRIYFPNGISQDTATELSDMGYIIYGNRVGGGRFFPEAG